MTNYRTGRSDVVRDDGQRPMRFRFDPAEPQREARDRFGAMRAAADEMFGDAPDPAAGLF